MIIVNQDKEQIHNFDKANYTEILLSGDTEEFEIVINYNNNRRKSKRSITRNHRILRNIKKI